MHPNRGLELGHRDFRKQGEVTECRVVSTLELRREKTHQLALRSISWDRVRAEVGMGA